MLSSLFSKFSFSYPASFYQIPNTCCIARLTTVIPIQHAIPIRIGLPPVFTSFTILVFRPIAAIAITIKNLDSSFSGANTSAGTPAAVAMVVITDAPMKNRMKNGNTCLIETFPAPSPFSRLVRISASTSVIGIIARVRVSFTVTALSSVWLPSPYRLSQVEAAAVTDEVSLPPFRRIPQTLLRNLLQSRGNLPMSETKSPPAR